ncbi:deoxyribonuclease IV [Patescibacteria group bacterium]|nr:deoxyribonuclease IV [Patescibacteria group bacterium]
MKIGCHVSIAGGIPNAPKRAADLGCECFQIFTRSPQGGKAAPITDAVAKGMREQMHEHKQSEFVVHTPYYINFGSTANNIFYGSVSVVRDELERASALGARYVMTHLGTFRDIGQEKGMEKVIKGLNKVLDGYKGETPLLLEIAAGAGEVIGDTFDELAEFSQALKHHKGFGGICFDTQHAFASGYDLRTPAAIKKTFAEFDRTIGLDLLRMSHVNDSKIELAGRKDRHDHIGEGHIGKSGFAAFLAFIAKQEKASKQEKPLILETEHDKVKADISALKALRQAIK